jgi:hypothetical protein
MPRITHTTPTRRFDYWCAMDNYDQTSARAVQTRSTGDLYAPDTAWEGQSETIILPNGLDIFVPVSESQPRINFIIDDGESVRVFYVAGWHDTDKYLLLHPFPVNTGAVRPDNGRPVDYSGWALGPRKTFHLKVTWKSEV